jgi:hypothetical protein
MTRSSLVEVEPTIPPPSDDQVILVSPSAVVQTKWIFFLKKRSSLTFKRHSNVLLVTHFFEFGHAAHSVGR